MSEKKNKGFNEKQWEAIQYSSSKDLLISAGAGSGKTKTLSERVKRLIEDKEIDPNALLVLTFTDNAAHEMKERIVSLFAKDPSTASLAGRMQSCHIQTFDSFCQYLVSIYAGRLGLSSAVSVLDGTIEGAKRREFLDQTIEEFLADPLKGEALTKAFSNFNTKSLSTSKAVLLDLDKKLHSLLSEDRETFFSNYEATFCDKEKFFAEYDAYIEGVKDDARYALLCAKYIDHFEDGGDGDLKPFESTSFFESTFYEAREAEHCAPYAREISRLLNLPSEEFVEGCKEAQKSKSLSDRFQTKKKEGEDEEIDEAGEEELARAKRVFAILKGVVKGKTAVFAPIYTLGSKEEEYAKFASFKDDAVAFLDIIKEMNRKLDEYKRAVNCFTFGDISSLALSLLQDERFSDVAEEIRSRFDYIMVDEYQDTNDSQEAFLNSLLKVNKQGKRAHLFCVGDPKQAIYGFRNSNVKLFINRQESLDKDCLIHMNTNYRSGEKLLIEINALFKAYMSKDHGDVDYTDPDEQLGYDKDVDLYGLPYSHFGISRIVSKGGDYDGKKPLNWEIAAIIDDIKAKVEDPSFLIYDAGTPGTQRRARYGDFAILCRKKSSFLDFQKAFVEAGLPLNIKVSNNLRDISCVIALESLVAFFLAIECKNDRDIPHLFASLARSYLFEYPDGRLFEILSKTYGSEGGDPIASIKEDAIYRQAADFIASHKGEDFPSLFRAMLEEFHVVSYLYKLGDVSDNMAKIDALYDLAVKETKMGEGISDFVGLFASIKKYQLAFESETSFAVENSVDLMTIHASKGLERKIVYMPVSQNREGAGRDDADYAFSIKYGVLFRDYSFAEDIETTSHSVYSLPYRLFLYQQGLHDPDDDEHVRLFYVAFTRAQSALIIVGDDAKRTKGGLYDALDYLPHQKVLNSVLLEDKIASRVLFKKEYDAYMELVKQRQLVPSLRLEDFKSPDKADEISQKQYRWYQKLRKEAVISKYDDLIDQTFSFMEERLYDDYLEQLKRCGNIDLIAKVYARYKNYPASISSLNVLNEYCLGRGLLKEGESMEGSLWGFQENLLYFRNIPLGLNLSKKDLEDEKKKKKRFVDAFLTPLCMAFDAYDYISIVSYKNPGFDDSVRFYSFLEPIGKDEKANPLEGLNGVRLSQETIVFPGINRTRASKKKEYVDEDSPIMEAINKGIALHRYMEMVDFASKDTSFIPDPKDRERIDKVLANPLFGDLKSWNVYKEYGYYDEVRDTTGFIDLLLEKDGDFLIIDYKSKNISDPAYEEQLAVYRENVARLFNVPISKIRAYLLPLTGEMGREVKFD